MNEAVNVSSTNNTKGTNSTEDYMNVIIRPLTEFVDIKEVYTHFISKHADDGSLGSHLMYRLMAAKLGVNFPSYLIYVPENGFNPLSREIVVERIPDEELRELRTPDDCPREPFKKTLIAVAYENDYRLPKKKEKDPTIQEVWWDILDDQLPKAEPFLLRRGRQIVDDEIRKVLSWNWPQFLDDLLYMGANKDPRIVEAAKTHLMPQFREMRRKNSIGIWMTNPNTGKSILAENLGKIIVRTTQKSITGGGNSKRNVVPSWLMSQQRVITVEMLEAVEIEALLAYMLTSLSGVTSHVVVWQTPQVFSPYCSLLVTGNPNRERGQPNFEVFFNYIQGISKNYVALGRRVSTILYGDEYAPCEAVESLESYPYYNNLWIIWREISNRILPLFRELYLQRTIQDWIHEPDPDYEARVKSVFTDEVMMIREFFLDHARNGHPALKYRALSSAIAQQAQELLRVSLGERDKDESRVKTVLEEAKQIYAQLKTVNCQSIKQIADTEKLDIKILIDIQEGLPRYLRELLVAIAHYITTLENETEFSIDALRETFDSIKDELGLRARARTTGGALQPEIAQSTWVTEFLPIFNYKEVQLIEIPKIQSDNHSRLVEYLDNAWRFNYMGQYDVVLLNCRKIIEELDSILKDKGFSIKKSLDDGRDVTVADWRGFLNQGEIGKYVDDITENIRRFCNRAAHSGKAIAKEDADYALLTTHAARAPPSRP